MSTASSVSSEVNLDWMLVAIPRARLLKSRAVVSIPSPVFLVAATNLSRKSARRLFSLDRGRADTSRRFNSQARAKGQFFIHGFTSSSLFFPTYVEIQPFFAFETSSMRFFVANEMPTGAAVTDRRFCIWTTRRKWKRRRGDSRYASCLFTTMKRPLIRQG